MLVAVGQRRAVELARALVDEWGRERFAPVTVARLDCWRWRYERGWLGGAQDDTRPLRWWLLSKTLKRE